MLYAQDHEYVPLADFGTGDDANGRPVDHLSKLGYLDKYQGNMMKFGCSVERFGTAAHADSLPGTESYMYSPWASCYGYNPYFGMIDSNGTPKTLWSKSTEPVKPNMIKSPSSKIFCGDVRMIEQTELRFIRYFQTWTEENYSDSSRAYYCHAKRANFAFADGHSEGLEHSSVGNKFNASSTEKTSTQYYLWPDYDGPKQ